jgi:hypothetical protein
MLQDPPWVEPPQIDAFDLSTLTHQILSVLAETGGCQASEVFNLIFRYLTELAKGARMVARKSP